MMPPVPASPDLSLLRRNITRLREDIRIQSHQVWTLLEAGLDCTGAARALKQMRDRLRLLVERANDLAA